jgi:hypothetical protein
VRNWRERSNPKFEVLGSKFRKPRTSDLEPSSVPLVSRVENMELRIYYEDTNCGGVGVSMLTIDEFEN